MAGLRDVCWKLVTLARTMTSPTCIAFWGPCDPHHKIYLPEKRTDAKGIGIIRPATAADVRSSSRNGSIPEGGHGQHQEAP